MDKKICLVSYNSRGFGLEKQGFIQEIVNVICVDKLTIFCNQENFLLRSNVYKIQQTLPSFQLYIKPAIINGHDRGRAKNGMFVAVPDCLKNQVEDISPDFYRIQVLRIKMKTSSFLLVNSYFPCDPQTLGQEDPELIESLSIIKNSIERAGCEAVVWAGDINADFLRATNYTDRVQETVDELNLFKSWDEYDVDFTSVHETANTTSVSKIDHFFMSRSLKEQVEDAGVIHHSNNKSDHCPVYVVFSSLEIHQESSVKKSAKPKPSWRRACAEERGKYRETLSVKLISVVCPVSVALCEDVHCKDEKHRELLDIFGAEVLGCIQEDAEATLPTPKASGMDKHVKSLACWDEVREF